MNYSTDIFSQNLKVYYSEDGNRLGQIENLSFGFFARKTTGEESIFKSEAVAIEFVTRKFSNRKLVKHRPGRRDLQKRLF